MAEQGHVPHPNRTYRWIQERDLSTNAQSRSTDKPVQRTTQRKLVRRSNSPTSSPRGTQPPITRNISVQMRCACVTQPAFFSPTNHVRNEASIYIYIYMRIRGARMHDQIKDMLYTSQPLLNWQSANLWYLWCSMTDKTSQCSSIVVYVHVYLKLTIYKWFVGDIAGVIEALGNGVVCDSLDLDQYRNSFKMNRLWWFGP